MTATFCHHLVSTYFHTHARTVHSSEISVEDAGHHHLPYFGCGFILLENVFTTTFTYLLVNETDDGRQLLS